MALKDIKQDLQKKDSTFAEREHDTTVHNEWEQIDQKIDKRSLWHRAKDALVDKRIRLIFITSVSLAVLAIIGVIVIFVVNYQRDFFLIERVSVTMEMPEAVVSNRTTAVTFTIKNDNRAEIRDLEISVQHGAFFIPDEQQDGFIPSNDERGIMSVGTISEYGEKRVDITGVFVAPESEVENIEATIRFTPEKRDPSVLTASVSTTVTSSPITLSIISEKDVVSGNLVDLLIDYENASQETIEDVTVVVRLPVGFTFIDADPAVASENTWLLGTLSAGEKGTLKIRGAAEGNIDNVENIVADIVVGKENPTRYSTATHAYRIVPPAITIIQQTLGDDDGIAIAGSVLEYTVRFKNTSDTPLRDAILRMQIDGAAPEYETLNLTAGGFYDKEKREIIWRASDVPVLSVLNPGDEGTVNFILPIKGRLPVDTAVDKNFSVTTVMSLESNDVSSTISENKNILSNAHVIKVGAKPLLEQKIEHILGPLPPRVGLETIYRVTFRVGSVNNDLHNVVIEGGIPSGMRFVTDDALESPIAINERTNTYEWNIGRIDSGTGIITEHREAMMDVVLVPGINDINGLPIIVKNGVLKGVDDFTDRTFESSFTKKTTQDIVGGTFITGSVQP